MSGVFICVCLFLLALHLVAKSLLTISLWCGCNASAALRPINVSYVTVLEHW